MPIIPLLGSGVAAMLQWAGVATSGQEGVETSNHQSDVTLKDLKMPLLNGIDPSETFYPNRQIPLTLWICLLIVIRCAPTFALDRDRRILQFHYTAWSVNDGAPSQIGSARDLVRFDGVKFEEYKPQPGVEFPSHGIYSLMATLGGLTFSPTGLGFLRNGSLRVFTRSEELPDSQVHSFGPHDHEWESFGEKDGLSGGGAYKLLDDREGDIWVGCSKGLVRFRHNQFVPVKPNPPPLSPNQ